MSGGVDRFQSDTDLDSDNDNERMKTRTMRENPEKICHEDAQIAKTEVSIHTRDITECYQMIMQFFCALKKLTLHKPGALKSQFWENMRISNPEWKNNNLLEGNILESFIRYVDILICDLAGIHKENKVFFRNRTSKNGRDMDVRTLLRRSVSKE